MSVTPFKPVTKPDAADVLGVCTKTIDNYIRDGLLPQPGRLAGRDLWHPDDFYSFLSAKLRVGVHPVTTPPSSGVDAQQTERPAPAFETEKNSGRIKPKAMAEKLRAINGGCAPLL
jgi:hypothetical protein